MSKKQKLELPAAADAKTVLPDLDKQFEMLFESGSAEKIVDELCGFPAHQDPEADIFATILQKTATVSERVQGKHMPAAGSKDVADAVFALAAETGEFSLRDKAGQVWQKELHKDPSRFAVYKALDTTAKKQYRAQWAKEKFSHCRSEKTFSHSWKDFDTRRGKYYTFGNLVRSYGGWEWPSAVREAKKHAAKAAIMGGRWIVRDEQFSGLVHILKFELEFKEVMEKCWGQFACWQDGRGSIPLPCGSSNPRSGSGGAETGGGDEKNRVQTRPVVATMVATMVATNGAKNRVHTR